MADGAGAAEPSVEDSLAECGAVTAEGELESGEFGGIEAAEDVGLDGCEGVG